MEKKDRRSSEFDFYTIQKSKLLMFNFVTINNL